jgi:hypothetical protein
VRFEELKEISIPSMSLQPVSSIGLHYDNELVDFMGQERESGVVSQPSKDPLHAIKAQKGVPENVNLRVSQLDEIVGAGYYSGEGSSQ